MEKHIVSILLISAAIISISLSGGCVKSEKNITAIQLYDQVYQFNTNLIDSIKVNSSTPSEMQSLFNSAKNVCIIFNGTSEEDNAYFAVVSYNVILKVNSYYTNLGEFKKFGVCDETNMSQADAIIAMRGPNTGATENSVILTDKTVTIQGLEWKEFEKAGDKLVLNVFGVTSLG